MHDKTFFKNDVIVHSCRTVYMLVLRNDYLPFCVLQHCCVVSSVVEGYTELGRECEVDSPITESTIVSTLCTHG